MKRIPVPHRAGRADFTGDLQAHVGAADGALRLHEVARDPVGHIPTGRHPQAGQAHAAPRCFRHNYATLIFEIGVEPLIAMRIVGHTDYQTTASIYTHLMEETLRKATVNMVNVFAGRSELKSD